MAIHGIRLFPFGIMIVLSTSLAGAQAPPASAADDAAATTPLPVRQKTLAELPPKPPKVVCSGNQLTISAENSTLESILTAVKGCSGAHIEIPEGAANARTFEELGPGPVRQVLNALLSGTEFNYVIESSDASPDKVDTVLLSVRKKDLPPGSPAPAELAAMTPARRAWAQSRQNGRPDPSAEESSQPAVDATPNSSAASTSSPAAAPAVANATSASTADAASAVPDTPPAPTVDAAANVDPPKATEERITSMQQMFDQRRSMIEKQNAATQNPVPAPN
jgi:hypothetical protein